MMPLWKFTPVAHRDDSRWQGREPWHELVVRADTAALARVVASDFDKREGSTRGIRHVGNESVGFRSAFEDEKLYWVTQIEAEPTGPSASGPPEVVRAEREAPAVA